MSLEYILTILEKVDVHVITDEYPNEVRSPELGRIKEIEYGGFTMISKDYKQNKKQVLALYDEFKHLCEISEKQVSSNIEEQARRIREEEFNLMVLGEAKSGKSTFINAYLGQEVVPMDVRQCTSSIIKIKRGNSVKLVAKTAAGGRTTIEGAEKVRDFLKTHAAISDKYRNIPITTINNEILIKKKGKKILKQELNSFLEAEAKDNLFNIDINEYNRLIEEYINEQKNSWGKIITEIDIEYPLSEAMQGITLIDSPGVGAAGNVGLIAEEYIKNANAIIFVKYLKGQAIESTTFMNFLHNNCSDRKKESLFLLLNGKADLQGHEFESLMEQAKQMYDKDIHPERIIGVDSKVHLFLNKCREIGEEEKIDEFFTQLDEKNEDFPPASNCWLKSMKKGGMSVFEEKMEELSNFKSVHASVEKFARTANYYQLIEFLDNLKKEYQRYKEMYVSTLKIAKDNVDDPDALADRIKEKQLEINDIYVKMTEVINQINKKYIDNLNGEGGIATEVEAKRKGYEEKLVNFKKLRESDIKDDTFSSLKKVTFEAIEEAKDFREDIAGRLIKECNERLIQYTDDPDKISAEAYIPNFTESDFRTIDNEAKQKSSGFKEIEKGETIFKTVEKVPYHYLKQHVNLVIESISRRLDEEIFPELTDNVINYVNECTEKYKAQLTTHKKELENEYSKLLNDQEKNENTLAIIVDLEKKIDSVDSGIEGIFELREELKNYVAE